MKPYGKIRYIDYYDDAPASARYILRQITGSVIFERYFKQSSEILLEFPLNSIENKKELCSTLTKCREIISPDRSMIWVEKPIWMIPDFEDNLDLYELYDDGYLDDFEDDRSEENWRDNFGYDPYDDF